MTKSRLSKTLTPQQEQYCQEFLKDLNQTQAALRSGYGKGESWHVAQASASRLMARPEIQARIQELMNQRSARTQISADMILHELLLLARSDIGEAFDETGALLPVGQMPEHVRRAVAAVEIEELFDGHGADRRWIGYTKKIKFWDKPRALELLGKHLKLFTDRLEVSGKVTLEALVAGSNGKETKDVPSEVSGSQPTSGLPYLPDSVDREGGADV